MNRFAWLLLVLLVFGVTGCRCSSSDRGFEFYDPPTDLNDDETENLPSRKWRQAD